jgi:hypothetical protein
MHKRNLWHGAVAAVALALAFSPTAAQEMPPSFSANAQASSGARALVDLTIRVQPPSPEGHCMTLNRGTVEATAQLTGDTTRPVRFQFWAPRGGDDAAGIVFSLQPTPTTMATSVQGGVYCYSVQNQGATTASPDGRFDWQDMTLRLTFTPPQ